MKNLTSKLSISKSVVSKFDNEKNSYMTGSVSIRGYAMTGSVSIRNNAMTGSVSIR
jgi:hypothetical protein